jgi:hypothetical protein
MPVASCKKYDAQSAEPCLCGKALARRMSDVGTIKIRFILVWFSPIIARRQLSLLHAAATSWAPERNAKRESIILCCISSNLSYSLQQTCSEALWGGAWQHSSTYIYIYVTLPSRPLVGAELKASHACMTSPCRLASTPQSAISAVTTSVSTCSLL